MSRLHQIQAKAKAENEFYTLMSTIEEELQHYTKHFANKIVYCNCDSVESNFFKYFVEHFNELKLKKLVCTCYNGGDVQLSLFDDEKESTQKAQKVVVTNVPSDFSFEALFTLPGNSLENLQGNGDFRSKECLDILKNSDIVITNPPFSLSIQFIKLMFAYDKKFLVLSNLNIIKNKFLFRQFIEENMHIGVSIHKEHVWFLMPEGTPIRTKHKGDWKQEGSKTYMVVTSVRWFSNLNVDYKPSFWELTEEYSPNKYQEYDNYRAIEVADVYKIPKNYDSVIGVPITFVDKWNREQFEIVSPKLCEKTSLSLLNVTSANLPPTPVNDAILDGKQLYTRLFIRRKK